MGGATRPSSGLVGAGGETKTGDVGSPMKRQPKAFSKKDSARSKEATLIWVNAKAEVGFCCRSGETEGVAAGDLAAMEEVAVCVVEERERVVGNAWEAGGLVLEEEEREEVRLRRAFMAICWTGQEAE